MNLRDRLRKDTRRAHDSVDAAFAKFDLTDPTGLRHFLLGHHVAFSTMQSVVLDDTLRETLDKAVADLSRDLALLGETGTRKPPPVPRHDAALAQGYLWHGSRLGTKMLARKWQEATDPTVLASDSYLSTPRDSAGWRALCAELEALDGYGALADRVLSAANAWFVLFETAGHEQFRRMRDGG